MEYGYLVTNDVIGPNVFDSFPHTPDGFAAALRWAGKQLGRDVVYEAEGPNGFFRNFGSCRRADVWERTGQRRRLLYTFNQGLLPEALARSRPSGLAEDFERLSA
jgi:hypothetical protein